MLFSWLTEHRRDKILAEPFPGEWLEYLQDDVPHYQFLTPDEQQHLRDLIQVFVAEKIWEGGGGLDVTPEMQVSIAAQACLLLLGFERHDFYKNVQTVLVYPQGYQTTSEQVTAAGVLETGSARLGEAWGLRGPVVLSWGDALSGGRNPFDGHNLVLHEFAHKLDARDGSADGVPPLPEGQEQYDEWHDAMAPEYDELVRKSENGRADLLDGYGATSPAEFFAVSTECFFEKPRQLKSRHERLYDVLQRYYRQDPAGRVEAYQQAHPASPEEDGETHDGHRHNGRHKHGRKHQHEHEPARL